MNKDDADKIGKNLNLHGTEGKAVFEDCCLKMKEKIKRGEVYAKMPDKRTPNPAPLAKKIFKAALLDYSRDNGLLND